MNRKWEQSAWKLVFSALAPPSPLSSTSPIFFNPSSTPHSLQHTTSLMDRVERLGDGTPEHVSHICHWNNRLMFKLHRHERESMEEYGRRAWPDYDPDIHGHTIFNLMRLCSRRCCTECGMVETPRSPLKRCKKCATAWYCVRRFSHVLINYLNDQSLNS